MGAAQASAPIAIDTVLIKVASRCNLDCDYCYVYNMGDEGWRAQPKRMSAATAECVARELGALYRRQGRPFGVVLHGGEPLLLGAAAVDHLCLVLREALPQPCGIDLQTNGVLLSDAIIDVLDRHDVGISISLDGPREVHDRHRLDRRGNGSHARVIDAIRRLCGHPRGARLFAGVLCVIDPGADPRTLYDWLKATGAPSIDFLPRDGNWDRLPYGKVSPGSLEYGVWIETLLDAYLADPTPPRVRILDDMLRLLLGGQSRKEGIGEIDYGILVIEPDGTITKNDTLKVAKAGADRFAAAWNVHRDSLASIVASDEFARYHRQQRPTAPQCLGCPERGVCGGGMTAHRWSSENGFDNPSIFCADQRHLISAMKLRVAAAGLVRKQESTHANL